MNHTLASRFPTDLGKRGRENGTDEHHNESKSEEPKVFQNPPNSISWLFNEPCMLLGIDINHPGTINIFIINSTLTLTTSLEPGSSQPSVASLVGSMDGSLSEYAAHGMIK